MSAAADPIRSTFHNECLRRMRTDADNTRTSLVALRAANARHLAEVESLERKMSFEPDAGLSQRIQLLRRRITDDENMAAACELHLSNLAKRANHLPETPLCRWAKSRTGAKGLAARVTWLDRGTGEVHLWDGTKLRAW